MTVFEGKEAKLSVLKTVYDFCAASYQEASKKGDNRATQAFQEEMNRLDFEMKDLEA